LAKSTRKTVAENVVFGHCWRLTLYAFAENTAYLTLQFKKLLMKIIDIYFHFFIVPTYLITYVHVTLSLFITNFRAVFKVVMLDIHLHIYNQHENI
jgi:hypothetical protein